MKKRDFNQWVKLNNRPVFICGHPKAGTSLMRSMLDSHPQLVVYPEETLFFRRYLPEANGKSLEGKVGLAEQLLIHIFQWNSKDPPHHQAGYPDRDYARSISFDRVRENMIALLDSKYETNGDLLSAAVLAFGLTRGLVSNNTQWWVEKSPYNELYFEKIMSWWPEAKFIHLIRDPRDNFASYHRKHGEWTASFFAENWVRSTKKGLSNLKKVGDSYYWMLRYEDLVTQPEDVIQKVCAFLSIDDHATLRIPTRNGQAWRGNSMFAEQFEQVSTAPIGRWEMDLDLQSVFIIQKICGKVMRELGYQLTVMPKKDISIKTWMEVWKTQLKGCFHRK